MTPDRTRPPAYSQTFDISIKEAETFHFGSTPVHVIEAGDQEVVKLEVLFPGAGSRVDVKKGASYLTWKLLSQGTSSRNAEEIAETFDQYGGFTENSPSLDTPSFTLYCLRRNLTDLLPVLQDVIHNPSFPEEEFALTKDIVREQLRVQNDKNSVLASKLFRENLFGDDHPYGKVMKEEDLEMLENDDISAFHAQYGMCPEILVSGKVSGKDIDEIGRMLGTDRERSIPQVAFPDSVNNSTTHIFEKERSLQSSLRIGLRTIPKTHEDFIALKIATHALGGYFGSRLMKNIREDKGYTYGIYSSLVSLEHDTYFLIGSDVQKEFREDAMREIHREIRQLADEPLMVSELQMVKNHLLGSFQSSITGPFALADKFRKIHYYGLDYSYYQQYIRKIQDITAEEIQQVMHTYLPSEKMLHVVVG